MGTQMQVVVYPVKDLAAAKALYSRLLGVEPYMDAPHYVGFRVGEQEFGLNPRGHEEGMTGPVGYWRVDDVQRALDELVAAGAEQHEAIRDFGGGRKITTVRDRDGNVTGLLESA